MTAPASWGRGARLGAWALVLAACGGAAAAPAAPSEPVVAEVAPAPPSPVVPASRGDGDGDDPPALATDDAGVPARDAALPSAKLSRTAPRHRPSVLDGPPRPASLAPGAYACRVDRTYRLRPCTVSKDAAGHTRLEAPGGLVELTGVLFDEGGALVFEGTMGEDRPFGCFGCQERCSESPGSCACVELPEDASRACLAQPLRVRLTKQAGNRRVGVLAYDTYMNRYVGSGADRHPEGADVTKNQFVVEIAPASALPRSP